MDAKGRIKKCIRDAKCVPTGFDIIGEQGVAQEYEFSKSFKNLVYGGSCRLFVSKVVADPKYMEWAKPIMTAASKWYIG